MGYLACIIIQSVTLYFGSIMFIAKWIITIGYCEFSSSLALDLKHDLREIGEKLIEPKRMNRRNRKLAQIEIAMKLVRFVNFHSDAKQLSIKNAMIFHELTFLMCDLGLLEISRQPIAPLQLDTFCSYQSYYAA